MVARPTSGAGAFEGATTQGPSAPLSFRWPPGHQSMVARLELAALAEDLREAVKTGQPIEVAVGLCNRISGRLIEAIRACVVAGPPSLSIPSDSADAQLCTILYALAGCAPDSEAGEVFRRALDPMPCPMGGLGEKGSPPPETHMKNSGPQAQGCSAPELTGPGAQQFIRLFTPNPDPEGF